MKICWLDVRGLGERKHAAIEEAVHQRMDAIVSDDAADLAGVPPIMKRVLLAGGDLPGELGETDLVLVDPARHGNPTGLAGTHDGMEFGAYVEIVDADSLELACEAARTQTWTLMNFKDPTKIPLEIVLAAAAGASGSTVTQVADVEEAGIVFGVLEHGSDGVMLTARDVGDATELRTIASVEPGEIDLVELTVQRSEHVGMGERACVDTCTYFRQDEGILVGSHSKGSILCVSETHPLPYMPTRPFRVNAGAIHSYTLSAEGRTHYLSELQAGSKILATDVKGQTRVVTVGRVKIETRPLIAIWATSADGREVNLILQDDWHVRVLGPGGVVHNSTELRPGDVVLGHLPAEDRHVGYPINEFCLEK